MTTTTVRTVPLDFAFDEETYTEAASRFSTDFGVTVELINPVGSAGGWPEVVFEGPRENVLHALREAYGMGEFGDDQRPEDCLEGIGQSLEPDETLPLTHGTPYEPGNVEAMFARSTTYHGTVVLVVVQRSHSSFSDVHTPMTIEAAEELRNQLSELLGSVGL